MTSTGNGGGAVAPKTYSEVFNLASALALGVQERFLKQELAAGIFKKALKDAGLYIEKAEIKEIK